MLSGLPELSFDVGAQLQPIPRFIVAGYPTIGGAGAFTGTTGGGLVNVRNRVYQVYDNFSWTMGTHALKTGAEFLWTEYNRTEAPSALGTYQFTAGYTSRTASNDNTGNALASFLLGQPQLASRAVGPSTIAGRQPYWSVYVQDDWRVNDRLTVNLGVRYELSPPMYDGHAVEKRLTNGFSLLSAYTLSRARSNAPQFRNAGGVNGSENSPPQDSFDLEAEWGPAYYGARHRWVTSATVPLPFRFHLSGIYSMQSGFPFTVNLRGDTAGVGAGTGGIFVRPNMVRGVSAYLPKSERTRGGYLNPAAFATPAAATFGSVGRHSIVGPGSANLDVAMARSIALARTRLELRAEAFNLTNRRNYTLVGRILNDATFGRLLSQSDPRQWQFGVRLTF